MDKFMGVGLSNLIGISIFVILFIIMLKVLTVKYPIKGISEAVAAV